MHLYFTGDGLKLVCELYLNLSRHLRLAKVKGNFLFVQPKNTSSMYLFLVYFEVLDRVVVYLPFFFLSVP